MHEPNVLLSYTASPRNKGCKRIRWWRTCNACSRRRRSETLLEAVNTIRIFPLRATLAPPVHREALFALAQRREEIRSHWKKHIGKIPLTDLRTSIRRDQHSAKTNSWLYSGSLNGDNHLGCMNNSIARSYNRHNVVSRGRRDRGRAIRRRCAYG